MRLYSRIVGTGGYLPSRIVTNDQLAASIETTDAWISSMTGIVQRHIAGDGESTTDMALLASSRALAAAGVAARDLDLIIVATITPDLVFPSTAALLQARLGAPTVGAVDLSAACSGFMYGLAFADSMLVAGRVRACRAGTGGSQLEGPAGGGCRLGGPIALSRHAAFPR